MARFYTADLHLGHRNILAYTDRPWGDMDAMNAALIDNINQVCGSDDELWVLGDVALGSLTQSLSWLQHAAPQLHLVSGNHDRCWGYARRGPQSVELYRRAGFASIADQAEHQIGKWQVALSHFPYRGDHTEQDRYAKARPKDDGRWLLCGHVHEAWRQRGRQINVGVDVRGFEPVSEGEISAIIENGPQDCD